MQDSAFSVIHRRRPLNDVVDDEWIEDCLSDDDIDIPQGAMVGGDDADDSQMLDEAEPKEEDKWGDLGLEQLAEL